MPELQHQQGPQNGPVEGRVIGLVKAEQLLDRTGRVVAPLEAASRQQYDPTHFQPVLFCAESFEVMYQMLREYLVNWK